MTQPPREKQDSGRHCFFCCRWCDERLVFRWTLIYDLTLLSQCFPMSFWYTIQCKREAKMINCCFTSWENGWVLVDVWKKGDSILPTRRNKRDMCRYPDVHKPNNHGDAIRICLGLTTLSMTKIWYRVYLGDEVLSPPSLDPGTTIPPPDLPLIILSPTTSVVSTKQDNVITSGAIQCILLQISSNNSYSK